MSKEPCHHGSVLPWGLKCDKGYLVIRLKTEKGPFNRGCGFHTPSAEKTARLILDDIRVKQRLGTFNLRTKAKRILFKDAADIFYKKHFLEYRNAKNQPRSRRSLKAAEYNLNGLREYFGDFYLDAITVKDLKEYRENKMELDDVKPATLNRILADMSSLINMFLKWVEEDEIDTYRLPISKQGAIINPCMLLDDFHEEPRQVNLTTNDYARLKEACRVVNEPTMWSIISTELQSWYRFSDLNKLDGAQNLFSNGKSLVLIQDKTNRPIQIPTEVLRPQWNKVFTNFRKRWDAVRTAAGLPDLQFRDLRKAGMHLAKQGGFTNEQISEKAGHASVSTTKRHYLDGMIRKEADPISVYIQGFLNNLPVS